MRRRVVLLGVVVALAMLSGAAAVVHERDVPRRSTEELEELVPDGAAVDGGDAGSPSAPPGSAGDDAAAESRDAEFGVFLNSPADVTQYREAFAAFEQWAGRRIERYKLNIAWDQGWSQFEFPFWLGEFDGEPVSIATPLFVRGASVDDVLRGAHDDSYRRLADRLIAHGMQDAILVLGWEFNTDWFPWGTRLIGDDAYVAAFRYVHDRLMERPGAAFTFDWASVPGEADPRGAYPGDEYVDFIGSDVYDRDWEFGPAQGGDWYVRRWNKLVAQDWGLAWLAEFAGAHGKQISLPEWGLVTRDSDENGGGDNPYFVEQVFAWVAANNVAYHAYHNSDNPDLSSRLDDDDVPNAADAFRELLIR